MGGDYDATLVTEARQAFAQSKRKAFYLLEDAGLSRPLIYKLCQVRPQHVHNELNNRNREDGSLQGNSGTASKRRVSTPLPSLLQRVHVQAPTRRPSLSGEGPCLFLVSCVRTKLSRPAAAKDLYASDWFHKARACVECVGDEWRILSAKYGAIHPDDEIRPYDRTLKSMPVVERRAWAQDVLETIESPLARAETVVFLAGERYREFLEPALLKRGFTVEVPMRGLSQGRQLSWLGACLEGMTIAPHG